VRCSHCGTTIEDGADVCSTCGTAVADDTALVPMAATPTVFEPGPSFNEPPVGGAGGQELPGWLQNFGGGAEDSPAEAAAFSAQAAAEHPLAAELPNWLAAPRADVAAPAPTRPQASAAPWDMQDVTFGGNDDNGFISEDDLPDWLRSIGDEPSPEQPLGAAHVTNGSDPAATRALQTPTVVSAWVTGRSTVALAERESLFADIASEEQHSTQVADQPSDDERPDVAVSEQFLTAPVEIPAATPAVAAQQNARRYLLYVALAVLLLLVIVLTQR
jgi:hypothetical protein